MAKGNEPGNIRTAKLYATRVLELGEIERIADLKESRVLKALQIPAWSRSIRPDA